MGLLCFGYRLSVCANLNVVAVGKSLRAELFAGCQHTHANVCDGVCRAVHVHGYYAKAVACGQGSDDVFNYPIPSTERLESHYFITFHYRRWLKSEFRNLADLDVRAVGFDLFCEAQDEAPVGTLPTDERLLAKLAGVNSP